jgi:hypothetical protein
MHNRRDGKFEKNVHIELFLTKVLSTILNEHFILKGACEYFNLCISKELEQFDNCLKINTLAFGPLNAITTYLIL